MVLLDAVGGLGCSSSLVPHGLVDKLLEDPSSGAGESRACQQLALLVLVVAKTWSKGVSPQKFHAAPSKKQACFLEGPVPLRELKRIGTFLEPPFAAKKVLRGISWLAPLAPILVVLR